MGRCGVLVSAWTLTEAAIDQRVFLMVPVNTLGML
jgi:hypothetical protein